MFLNKEVPPVTTTSTLTNAITMASEQHAHKQWVKSQAKAKAEPSEVFVHQPARPFPVSSEPEGKLKLEQMITPTQPFTSWSDT